MSLYDRLYEASKDCLALAASACEQITDEVATDFLLWYIENESEDWLKKLTINEAYQQFKLTL